MDFSEYKNVWVLIETDNGKAENVGLELLNPGAEIAHRLGEKVVGVVLGANNDEAIKAAFEHGADEVISVVSPALEPYTTDPYAYATHAIIEKYKPNVILVGATIVGRDFAPRVSCRLGTGLTADCTSLDIDEESRIMAWTRPAFGGNLMATILCETKRPQIGRAHV